MTTRYPLTVILSLLLIALPVSGQCAPQANAGSFWSQLVNKLEGFAPQKKAAVTTAVGGVRGSKDKSADTLYWKDEASLQEIAEKELNDFRLACLTADAGESAKARGQFETFLSEYPQSPLRSDAQSALSRLSEEAAVPPASDPTSTTVQAAAVAPAEAVIPAADSAAGSAPAPTAVPQ